MGRFNLIIPFAPPQSVSTHKEQFIVQANVGIQELNQLIEQYNAAEGNNKEQLAILYDIYLKQKDIDFHLPQTILGDESSQEYRKKIHYGLFKETQIHFKELGVDLLEVDSLKGKINDSQQVNPHYHSSLSEILANMPPEKVDELELILLGGSSNKDRLRENLVKLYSDNEDGYEQWQKFLTNHSIEKLRGNNSKNYKVTNVETGTTCVLKAENRLDQPREVLTDLNEHFQREVLSNRVAERNGAGGSIYITDFLPDGDLESHSKKEMDDATRINNALAIYPRMGATLQAMSKDNYFFPDMKNSNWLLDDLTPKISDSKSFFPLNEDGFAQNRKYYYRILSTMDSNAPEMRVDGPHSYSADKAHAYMLGKNLYHYLTGHKYNDARIKKWYAPSIHNGKDFNFEDTVFQTEEGVALQELIEQLVTPTPENRISVEEAVYRLRQIQELSLEKNYCRNLINELGQYRCSKNSAELTFNSERLKEFDAEKDIDRIRMIRDELEKIRENTLHDIKQFPEIREELARLKTAREECNKILEELRPNQHNDDAQQLDAYIKEKRALIDAEIDLDTLAQIKDELIEKKLASEKNECHALLEQLQALNPRHRDMGVFFEEQHQRINDAHDKDAILDIKGELQERYTRMELDFAKKTAYMDLAQLRVSKSGLVPDKIINDKQQKLSHSNTTEEIESIMVVNRCEMLLHQLKAYQFGEHDHYMMNLIDSKKHELKDALDDLDRLKQIETEFKATLSTMADNSVINGVKEAVDELKRGGSDKKLSRVQDAMAEIPLERRGDLLKDEQLGQKVLQELATRRNVIVGPKLALTGDGKIDEKNAAQSFITFKKRAMNMKPQEETSQNNNNQINIRGMR